MVAKPVFLSRKGLMVVRPVFLDPKGLTVGA